MVTLEADVIGLGGKTSAQLRDSISNSTIEAATNNFSAALTVPLSSSCVDDGLVVTSAYMPVESFDRGGWIGNVCRDGCALDLFRISGMSVYMLFQEAVFDVRLRSIKTVIESRSLEPEDDVIGFIMSTISSGGGLYDKGYIEVCSAMY